AAATAPARGSPAPARAARTGGSAEAGLAGSGATKAALLSLIETLNAAESAHGVTATALAPAIVDPDMAT
ncbi:short-chain dehydrogenase, partial [Rhodococcus ruber]|nr:short-chain dehydrogenase [Rhodococcus ruber]